MPGDPAPPFASATCSARASRPARRPRSRSAAARATADRARPARARHQRERLRGAAPQLAVRAHARDEATGIMRTGAMSTTSRLSRRFAAAALRGALRVRRDRATTDETVAPSGDFDLEVEIIHQHARVDCGAGLRRRRRIVPRQRHAQRVAGRDLEPSSARSSRPSRARPRAHALAAGLAAHRARSDRPRPARRAGRSRCA